MTKAIYQQTTRQLSKKGLTEGSQVFQIDQVAERERESQVKSSQFGKN